MLNVAFIIGGLIAIAIAIWGKRFYDADAEGMPYRNEREVSPRWGKLIFGLVGIVFLIGGIVACFARNKLTSRQHPASS
ncbi:MAG TPA: hypothetical protein VGE83_03705 [Terracidiphilus sp.]|jgi:hypothetical protein